MIGLLARHRVSICRASTFGWKLGSAFRSFRPLNVLNCLLAPFWETEALCVKLRGIASFCFRAYPRWLNIAGAAMTGF